MALSPSHAGQTAPQWRQFTFFDVEDVKDEQDLAQSPRAIRQLTPPVVITTTAPKSPLSPSLIVSSSRNISILDKHFSVERSFTAWEQNGRATFLLEAAGLLVAIGEEEGTLWPLLKVWDLTKEDKKSAERRPVLLRSVRIQHGQRPHPVRSSLNVISLGESDLVAGIFGGSYVKFIASRYRIRRRHRPSLSTLPPIADHFFISNILSQGSRGP